MDNMWRSEVKTTLGKSAIYNRLLSLCSEDDAGHHVLCLIDEATYYAYQRAKLVLKHMGEYTLHDGDHQFQVLRIMELILGRENLDGLTLPELMLLILSAFFHDIGMAPCEQDVTAWKKNWDESPEIGDEERNEYNLFRRYIAARPDKISLIDDLASQGDNSRAEMVRAYLVSEYIRETHSIRGRSVIEADWNERIRYRDTDLTVEFAEICASHSTDALSLLSMDFNYLCGNGTYACLPLIAVLLRIADILDFDSKRTPEVLLSNLAVKNPVSLKEWKKHRSVEAWIISPTLIQYHAKCRHPAIESAIHAFCDMIDSELGLSNNVISEIHGHLAGSRPDLRIVLPLKVDRTKIETKKNIHGEPEYLFKETRFNLSKNQVVELLMGTKLYGSREFALRELLQNSIDACLLRKDLEKSWGNPYVPEICVRYHVVNEESVLEVEDNGVGMDQYIVDKYYTNVGSSFYKSTDFYDLRAQANSKFQPTSRFGIGILSCFMISDTLAVDTRRIYGPHSSSEPLSLSVDGQGSIFWIRKGDRSTPGTTTRLILRKSRNPWQKLTDEKFVESVERVLPNPPFSVKVETSGLSCTRNESSFADLSIDSMKGNQWQEHENIRQISIDIHEPEQGIVGSVLVGILENHGVPTSRIDLGKKTVDIDDETYDLDKSIFYGRSAILQQSTSITIDEDLEIESTSGFSTLMESSSRVSLHGIEVPVSLFSDSWQRNQQHAFLEWPMPILIIVDICGSRDIDLNSARNQIVTGRKWMDFEEALARPRAKSRRRLEMTRS